MILHPAVVSCLGVLALRTLPQTAQVVILLQCLLSPPQAAALSALCSVLGLADGLRALVLDLRGRAAEAVPDSFEAFGALGGLTQLDSLQLHNVHILVGDRCLKAALSPLTQLTRLYLQFGLEGRYVRGRIPAPWWQTQVSKLINLRELTVASASEHNENALDMMLGALAEGLSQLRALRHLHVLGVNSAVWDVHYESNRLQLAALPALETVALRLHTVTNIYPGLGQQRRVVLSRLVSLSLALRVNNAGREPYRDTYLPAIVTPALTEIILDDVKLASDSEELPWLPDLPKLRRLELVDLKTGSKELPQGVMACSSLTELVLKKILLGFSNDGRSVWNMPDCRMRSLPAAGPYLGQLVRLSLLGNAFATVPPALANATALQQLDMGEQLLRDTWASEEYHEPAAAPVLGLHVLDNMKHLRSVNFVGFVDSGASIRHFRAKHPTVTVVFERNGFPEWMRRQGYGQQTYPMPDA